jgi:hypothetical protein
MQVKKNVNQEAFDQIIQVHENIHSISEQNGQKKEMTDLQLALKDLQNISKRFNYPISGKQIARVMKDAFLSRFPQGTSLCHGKVSCFKSIDKCSVVILNCAIQEWILQEGYEIVQFYFDQVIHDFGDLNNAKN